MTPVVWSVGSLRDLVSVWREIAAHDLAVAERFQVDVDRRVALLQDFPEIGSPLRDGRRKLTIGRYSYTIRYRITSGAVRILAIRHMARRGGGS